MLKDKYKYEVWVSGIGTCYCNTENEVWEFVGKGSFGSSYEVTNPKDGSLYSEMIPF